MPRYFAFLRAINVGGHTVTMDRLRKEFETMGFANVETFIASGNVIFDSPKRAPALESQIATALEKALGYAVPAFLRTPSELAAIATHESFSKSALANAAALNVVLTSKPLDAAAQKKLITLRTDIDDFHTHEREIYWLCSQRQSQSKISNVVLEKALGIQSTIRGINTIRKMAEKFA